MGETDLIHPLSCLALSCPLTPTTQSVHVLGKMMGNAASHLALSTEGQARLYRQQFR